MGLSDLADKYGDESQKEGRFRLPALPLGVKTVVTFDQALVNTGVVMYDGNQVRAKTLRAPKDTEELTGHARTIARSMALQTAIMDVLVAVPDFRSAVVLCETPMARAAARSRGESSLLGAHAVHMVAKTLGIEQVYMVSAQRAKTVVAGNAKADKKDIARALRETYLSEQIAVCTNEHERDALALMVTYLKTREADHG